MRVLIACEFSGRVRDAFRAKGCDAWSVDILPTEADPAWHIQGDALAAAVARQWDLMVAFPPCTYLSKIGARWWPDWRADGRQDAAAAFVQVLWNCPVPRVAIENPVGWLNTNWRKPSQIIQPYEYGEPWRKTTCLWLRGLPALKPTDIVEPVGAWVDGGKTIRNDRAGSVARYRSSRAAGGGIRNSHERSRTFQGIARAMAEQWCLTSSGPQPSIGNTRNH